MLFRKTVVLHISVLLILILNGCEVAFYNPFEKDTYKPKDAPKDITSFIFEKALNTGLNGMSNSYGIIGTNTVDVTVPYGSDISTLIPSITISAGATISPNTGTGQTFTNGIGIQYTVTGSDGSTKNYTVTVNIALASSKDITYFAFTKAGNPGVLDALPSDAEGTITDLNIDVTFPVHTDISSLIPTISITGASVNPLSGASRAFSDGSGVTYTVTAFDSTYQDYSVTVYNPPEVTDGTLTFTGVGTNTITVNWIKATDDQTPQDNLQYLVYYSLSSTNMDTVANIEANVFPLGSIYAFETYTANIGTKTITGLDDNTKYYFNVVVRDQSGNKAVYAVNNNTTLDGTPPVPGNGSPGLTFGTVTASSIVVNWNAAFDEKTPVVNLEYLVCYSLSSINMDTLNGIETNTFPLGSIYTFDTYTANIGTKTITALDDNTKYYFNVLVRDQAGHKAVYAVNNNTTLDGTPPVPGNGSPGLTFGTITASSIVVNWNAAFDEKTPVANLEYLVCYSLSSINMDTVNSIEANTFPLGSIYTFDIYTANICTKTITGLNDNTKYYFNVIVRDQAGNKAVYAVNNYTTLDGTPPTPGNSGTLTLGGNTSNSITVNWTLGTDNKDTGNLKYRLYYSTTNTISTVGTITSGTAVGSLTDNDSTETASVPAGTYYFNVLIQDTSGNNAVYAMTSFSTLDNTAPTSGNSGLLMISAMGSTSATVNWTKAADDVTPQANLEYCLYYSMSHILTSLSDIDGETPYLTFTADISSMTISGLSSSTLYYFNVVVRDQASPTKNRTAYAGISRMTLPGTSDPPTNSATIITTAYPFTNPYRMAYYGGYIYITDKATPGTSKIVKFTPGGTGENFITGLTNPGGICTEGSYIYLGGSGYLNRYTMAGGSAGSTSLSSDYYGLAFDGIYPDGTYPDGATYYFVTFNNASEKSIERITDYWGRYNFVTIENTSLMMDLCTDGVNVYVSDNTYSKILKIDRGTKAVTTLYNLSSNPLGIETDGKYVYVAMASGPSVKILISDGSKTDMPTITGVNDFVYDGTYLYAAVGSGGTPGIYKLN
jgi:hypothetical protein